MHQVWGRMGPPWQVQAWAHSKPVLQGSSLGSSVFLGAHLCRQGERFALDVRRLEGDLQENERQRERLKVWQLRCACQTRQTESAQFPLPVRLPYHLVQGGPQALNGTPTRSCASALWHLLLQAELEEKQAVIKDLETEKEIQAGGEIRELQADVDHLSMEWVLGWWEGKGCKGERVGHGGAS